MDVFVALLLSQAPNLRRLRIDSDFQQKSGFVGYLFEEVSPMSENKYFKVLGHVEFSLAVTSQNMQISLIMTSISAKSFLFFPFHERRHGSAGERHHMVKPEGISIISNIAHSSP